MVASGLTLTLSEIMHSPLPGSDLEFIELKNSGPNPLLLTDVQIYVDGASSAILSSS